MVFLFFTIIFLMRLIQSFSLKKSTSISYDDKTSIKYANYYMFVASLIGFVTLLLFNNKFLGFNISTFICAFVFGTLLALSFLICLAILKDCSIVVHTTFALGGIIITCLISLIWFNEKMSIIQILFLFVFLFGVVLLVSGSKKEKTKISLKTLILLICNMFIEGLQMSTQKYFTLKVENGNLYTFQLLTFIVGAVLLLIVQIFYHIKHREYKISTPIPKSLYLYGLLVALTAFSISFFVTSLSNLLYSIIVFPISAFLSLIASFLVGVIIFKDKFSFKNILGAIISLASISIICIFTTEVLNSMMG